jgi:hypothetical protein
MLMMVRSGLYPPLRVWLDSRIVDHVSHVHCVKLVEGVIPPWPTI